MLIAGDALAAGAACSAAYWLRLRAGLLPVEGDAAALPSRYLEALPVAICALLAATAFAGMYGARRIAKPAGPGDLLRVTGLGTLALTAAALLYWKEFQYSRTALVLAGVLYGPAFALGRQATGRAVRSLFGTGRFTTDIAVVGGGLPADSLARSLAQTPWMGLRVAVVLELGPMPATWADARRVEGIDELVVALVSGEAAEVFVALPADHAHRLPTILAELHDVTANVSVVPDLGGALLLNPAATVVSGTPVISVRERPLYGWRALCKRAVDVTVSSVLLVLLSPLLLLVALIVKLSSAGPVLYLQERMGLDGRPFSIVKFRTMRRGAEDLSGPVFATEADPRATAVGSLLRRFSVDELPQLWNVLKGDMSLVGPRPERAPFIEDFRRRFPGYMLRHSVKAGMTGWAQVHGLRGQSSLEERLRYDLEYIDRWSLLLDLEILGRTAVQVVAGRNAY